MNKHELLQELYAMEEKPPRAESPADIAAKLLPYKDERTETFVVFGTDNKNHIIATKEFKGTVDQAAIYPREVFRFALLEQASGIILGHNHPGGDPIPSRQDRDVTKQIIKGSKYIGLRVLDHVIIGRDGHYSFKEEGLL